MNFKDFLEMALTNANHIQKLNAAMDWIKQNNIIAVAIGGTAVAHYMTGARDDTDVDFVTDNINVVAQRAKFNQLQYSPLSLNAKYQGIIIPSLDVDFIQPPKPILQMILSTASKEMIGNTIFPVISPEALVIVKFELGRDKDLTDAFNLLKSGLVDKQKYLSLVKKMSKYMDTSDLMMYASMIGPAANTA